MTTARHRRPSAAVSWQVVMRGTWAALLLTLTLGTLAAAQQPSPGPAASPLPAPSASPLPAALAWATCADPALAGLDCAVLEVPVDWGLAETGLPTALIPLALARHPAIGEPAERLGTLVLGPESPGDAATIALPTRWAALPEPIRERFDVVTWDPRGAGGSMPLRRCPEPAIEIPPTGAFDADAVLKDARAARRAATRACAARNGEVMSHMGTRQSARDLEAIRGALGDEPLTYAGSGFGARIGAVHAAAYPGRVRALVLDGPSDPYGTLAGRALAAITTDSAIGAALQREPDAAAVWPDVLEELQTRAIRLPSGADVTRWNLTGLLAASASDPAAFAAAAALVLAAHDAQTAADPGPARARLDMAPWPATWPLGDASTVATECADHAERLRPGELRALVGEIRLRAPVAGWLMALAPLVRCEGFRFARDPVSAAGVPGPSIPVLVLASTRSAGAPASDIAAFMAAVPHARGVTVSGAADRLLAAGAGACVDDALTAFLTDPASVATDRGCPAG